MTAQEKMTQRLNEWRAGLGALEQKLAKMEQEIAELTLAVERQRGAIAAAEALLTMVDDEVIEGNTEEATADAPGSNEAS